MKTFFMSLTLLAIASSFGFAQDPNSDYFSNPEPDSPADTAEKVPFDTFTKPSIRFFESLDVSGYYVTGYDKDGKLIDTPVNQLNFGFGSDARLDRSTRGYASFYIAYPKPSTANDLLYNPYEPPINWTAPDELQFSSIIVKELFFDYSLGDFAIIRAGRQTATWGQGRLFNPANFVTNIGNGMAVKVSSALGPVALTAVAVKNDDYYFGKVDESEKPTGVDLGALNTLGTAGLAEYSSPWFTAGLSGFYQRVIGPKGAAYVKTSLWGADLFLEGLGEWDVTGHGRWSGVAGFYRDFGDQGRWLKLQAEYLISGRGDDGSFRVLSTTDPGWNDQTLGLAATSDLMKFIDLKPSVLWLHSMRDGSGEIVLGLINTSLPHIELTAAVVRVYGNPDGRYVVNNPDPNDRNLLLTLKLTAQFEIKN